MALLPRSRKQIGDNLSLIDGNLFFSRLQTLTIPIADLHPYITFAGFIQIGKDVPIHLQKPTVQHHELDI